MELYHAAYYMREDGDCRCTLCPNRCRLKDGAYGRCHVRVNRGGVLYSESYGRVASVNIDPIEKKPLVGFMPGTRTFSVGTLGCNLDCDWCQNDSLSRFGYDHYPEMPVVTPDQVVEAALRNGTPSISYTYNEPAVFAEFVMRTAELAHRNNLANILVTNGYVSPEAARDLYTHIDAANFDVKGFTEEFYRKYTKGRLSTVLENVEYFHHQGKHAELTMLIVPGLNDDLEHVAAFANWVINRLSSEVIVHFSAFHPAARCMDLPRTSRESLFAIRNTALGCGLKNVMLGNIQ